MPLPVVVHAWLHDTHRVIALGAWLAAIAAAFFVPNPALLLVLVSPLIAGATVPLLRVAAATSRINDSGRLIDTQLEVAAASRNTFVRYLARPFWGLLAFVWRETERLDDIDARAGARLGAALYIAGAAVAAAYIAARLAVPFILRNLLLLLPALLGLVVFASRRSQATDAINGLSRFFATKLALVTSRNGVFSKYLFRPVLTGLQWLWLRTEPLADADARAGLRLCLGLYLTGTALFVALLAAWIVVSIIVGLLLLALVFYILSLGSSNSESTATSSTRRPATSRRTTDWMGNAVEEHFDSDGEKIGESRPGHDWLGNDVTEHFDPEGNRTGESKPTTDWIGNPVVEHFTADGDRAGESRPSTNWLGNPTVEHFDRNGQRTGESRRDHDWLGNPETRHEHKG